MLRAVYKNETNSWLLYFGDSEILEYTLDYVPAQYIVQKAVESGKLPEHVVFDEPENHINKNILDWFEQEVWTSKEFGRDLIQSLKEIVVSLLPAEGEQEAQ